MEIRLKKKVKNPIIIEGFPGYGLIGTLVTEFLIKHLDAKQIGRIRLYEVPPLVAIHDGKVVEPLGIFYDEKRNVVILHALSSASGLEWKIADIILKLSKELSAKEIISIEGVGSQSMIPDSTVYFYGKNSALENSGIKKLNEGIIVGVTGALLLKDEGEVPLTCVFAETHSTLPDSKAAAKVIEVVAKYLGVKVDIKPMIARAKEFEDKIKNIINRVQETQEVQEKKKPSYFG
ncbi:MAG TPA: PAC2 family protein [Candidatus Nanoarchaeia archaeon]|nr:PAC2 family protein [Candidatus Nanoarchaeia archaeon]